MKKSLITNCKEIVDINTGEILAFESQKVVREKVDVDNFYMIFTEYSNRLYKVHSGVAHNVFIWLCSHAEFNTGNVLIPPAARVILAKELDISDSQLTHALRVLKEHKLISGEKGMFNINPQIFWRGDQRIRREELLKNKVLQITYELVDDKPQKPTK